MCIVDPVTNSKSEIIHGCITIQSSTQDPKEKMLKIIGLSQTKIFFGEKGRWQHISTYIKTVLFEILFLSLFLYKECSI